MSLFELFWSHRRFSTNFIQSHNMIVGRPFVRSLALNENESGQWRTIFFFFLLCGMWNIRIIGYKRVGFISCFLLKQNRRRRKKKIINFEDENIKHIHESTLIAKHCVYTGAQLVYTYCVYKLHDGNITQRSIKWTFDLRWVNYKR